MDGSRAPRIEGFEGQAPPEDRELIDVSGDGSEECLPPLVDGCREDLLAPGVPLRNPLVLPSSSSSSSSVPPARSHPKGVRPVGDEKEGKYGPLGGPLILPGYPSPSSSSAPPARSHPKGVRHVVDAREEKYGPLRSPTSYRDDAGGKSALELLIQALQMGGSNRRTNLDDLRIQILAGYQPFDPARHNIVAWTAGFKRLVPDDASDEQVIRLLEC